MDQKATYKRYSNPPWNPRINNMYHLTKQNSSFVILVFGTLSAILTAIILLSLIKWLAPDITLKPNASQADLSIPDTVSTEGWQDYQDPNFPLLIKLPAEWKISTATNLPGYYTIILQPKPTEPNIKIFISDKAYAAISGLESIDFISSTKYQGLTVDYLLYAFKSGDYYYTFDSSLNTKYRNELYTIVNSVKFE